MKLPTAPTVPIIQSDNISTFILFLIITGMFLTMMISIGKSFEFVKKPIENESEIIKKITKDYLLVFNQLLLIYIYFIFICFILKDSFVGKFVKFLFIAITFVISFIVMVFASDALKKINELPSNSSYNEYKKVLTGLIFISVILIVIILLWIFLRWRANKKPKQQSASKQIPKLKQQ